MAIFAEAMAMRVSKEQAAENRERILDVATRLFRERGFDGIGVADLMKEAGLTHGGFYGHFASKEDLMAKACQRAIERALIYWQGKIDNRHKGDPLTAIVKAYLSPAHFDDPGKGCLIAALGSDVARQSDVVRHTVTEGTQAQIELLASLQPGDDDASKREAALALYASMIGAMVLARAVDDAGFAREILAAVGQKTPSVPLQKGG
jgi:TetR/AcrR family transcriptional repressor of nem operon